MITIRIWSARGEPPPSLSLLEKARNLRMPGTMAYRMDDDDSLLIELPYSEEQVKLFEKLLEDERFGRVPSSQAGPLKKACYCII